MARKLRHSKLESRTARLKLAVRRKPYPGPNLARGVQLMYRRNKTNGTWVLKASDGHGKYWTKAIAEADDFDESNGKILTFFEAQDVAKKMARGGGGSADTAPITVDDALNDYRRDLEARNANPYNADWPRLHLTSVLLSKPAALLAATELKKWRDSLLGAMAPSTINRLCRCLCAALELAAQHDDRIKNRQAWEVGLAGLPDAQEARNVIISDEKVREFVASAYGLDGKFGLLADTLAITGARPSSGGSFARQGSAGSSGAAKIDDAEVSKRRRQKPEPEKDRALQRADHRRAIEEAEGGGGRPCRRCAAAAAKRRQPLG